MHVVSLTGTNTSDPGRGSYRPVEDDVLARRSLPPHFLATTMIAIVLAMICAIPPTSWT